MLAKYEEQQKQSWVAGR